MPIRAATLSDLPAVMPMVAKVCQLHEAWDAAKYGFLPAPEERYKPWLSKLLADRRSIFLVAEEEVSDRAARLVGFLIATIEREIPIYRLKEYGFIHDLWIEPEYRRTGIARDMVKVTIERFREKGVQQIRLDTAVANEAARRLFSSCGFRPSIIEMLTELDG